MGSRTPTNTLSDSYDTLYTRKAVYSGSLDIEDQLNCIGVIHCQLLLPALPL